MAKAIGVISMGGYNTFCEVLSLDKRAVIIPRTVPRLEQYIRASRAQELGLVRMLLAENGCPTKTMVTTLRNLPSQPLPSTRVVPGLLRGRRNVVKLTEQWLAEGRDRQRFTKAKRG
jgi:predicted glycosyltransferase